jgi:hypothetical protein
MGPPALQTRSLIGRTDVSSRKKQRKTDSETRSQAPALSESSVYAQPGSSPMDTVHRANGHAPTSTTRTTRDDIANFEHWAASDDASGLHVAETAPPAAACAPRQACAEMAPASAEGQRLPPPGAATRPHRANGKPANAADHAASEKDASSKNKTAPKIPPATEPLPADGPSFVEAVHEKVDLVELEVSLLQSEDEKIRQRELAYLRELIYGKNAAFSTDDEMGPITFGPPPITTEPAGGD